MSSYRIEVKLLRISIPSQINQFVCTRTPTKDTTAFFLLSRPRTRTWIKQKGTPRAVHQAPPQQKQRNVPTSNVPIFTSCCLFPPRKWGNFCREAPTEVGSLRRFATRKTRRISSRVLLRSLGVCYCPPSRCSTRCCCCCCYCCLQEEEANLADEVIGPWSHST